jgi:hypothetical protein
MKKNKRFPQPQLPTQQPQSTVHTVHSHSVERRRLILISGVARGDERDTPRRRHARARGDMRASSTQHGLASGDTRHHSQKQKRHTHTHTHTLLQHTRNNSKHVGHVACSDADDRAGHQARAESSRLQSSQVPGSSALEVKVSERLSLRGCPDASKIRGRARERKRSGRSLLNVPSTVKII